MGDFDEDRSSPLPAFLISERAGDPVLFSVTSRPGQNVLGGGFPCLRQGALCDTSSNSLRNWFLHRAPIQRSIARRRFLSKSVSSSRLTFVPFGAADLCGLTAKGHHFHSPHMDLIHVALAVSPGFATRRSPRNTLLYAFQKKRQAFFHFF